MAEPAFTYDVRSARYRSVRTGRFLSEATVRQAIDDVVRASAERVAGLTGRLAGGHLDLATWQQQMVIELKALHVANATVARGGRARMSPADYGRVGAELRRQYRYLSRFAGELASGAQSLDGRALARGELYAEAGRQTYGQTLRRLWADKGAVQERWLLHAAESCPGCRGQAARGWVAEGQLPTLGTQPCLTRCKCSIISRLATEAAA